jgi:ubiquinone/menaquinone biosynthesis C-methylase UbiE
MTLTGCHRFYETTFLPVQAEFDHLPFSDNTADIVVFKAALHYSVDIHATLIEALRLLNSTGSLIILDSPIYHKPQSEGRWCVNGRHASPNTAGLHRIVCRVKII